MTIREKLEAEMDKQEIKELEENNANNKECNKMDNSNCSNRSNANWNNQNQRVLDSRRQCGISVFNGIAIMVCAN